jgi:hypothetical protein
LAVYARLQPPHDERLPGDYLTERADIRIKIAELELDRQQPAADVPTLIQQAEAEYRRCWPDAPENELPLPLQALLGRVEVARGKYHFFRKETAKATTAVKDAEEHLKTVRAEKADRLYDQYRLALVFALKAQLPDPGQPQDTRAGDGHALSMLEEAVSPHFKHLERLKRERGFERLRQSHPQQFEAVVKTVEKQRGWPAGAAQNVP